MAQPADRPGGLSNLQKRILSAAVLLPIAVAAGALGHPYFDLLVAAFAAAMGWEWTRVVAHKRLPGQVSPVPVPSVRGWEILAAVAIAAALGTVASVSARQGLGCTLIVILAGVAASVIASLLTGRERTNWFMAGILYVAVPAATLVAIRADPGYGLAGLLWIIALVVAADIGGYVAGRSIGGPKLAPRISPNKTWSGLAGAVAGAALVGLSTAFVLNHTNVWMLTLLSAGLGLVEQAGDLVESSFKRHFGVKDTSQIIPGHGGVLDRVDGLLAVALAVFIANTWMGGSVLAW